MENYDLVFSLVLTFDGSTSIESSCHSQCHMYVLYCKAYAYIEMWKKYCLNSYENTSNFQYF